MNATTNRLDNQHTPGFIEVTSDEMQQLEGGSVTETLQNLTPPTIKDLAKLVICGGPNGQL